MKATDTGQTTLWQFTVESGKEAVRLYFQPVQKVFGWLGASSQKSPPAEAGFHPAFDSLEDLKARFKRLQLEVAVTGSAAYATALTDIENLLHSAQRLGELREKIRQMEIDLGLEKNFQAPGAKRSIGASGD